ncbi:hypothetical protein EIP86_009441 [Pleurotus ostreatoroseus]|nr:hypothetical protein EIP86_009441 [Pleurotus ostreatoroseus]
MQYSQGYSPQSLPAVSPNARSFYTSNVPHPSPHPPQYQYSSPPPTPHSPPSTQYHPQATPYAHNPYHHNTYPQPAAHGGYPHPPHHAQTQPAPQPQASSPSYGSASTTGNNSPGYTPVSFHRPSGPLQGAPEQFYGSLFDAKGEPTEIFARMSDALFFHVDQNCDVPGLQNTGLIEPGKQVWAMIKNGQKSEDALAVQGHLKSYYDLANIRYCYTTTRFGEYVVALDRQGWLHMHVFDAISDPDEAFSDWSKYITTFQLKDPLTNAPFPTPFPRSALPTIGNQALKQVVENWKVQTVVAIVKERQVAQTQMTNAITNALIRPTVTQPSFNAAAAFTTGAAFGATAAPFIQQQPQYQYTPTPVVVENITQAAPAANSSGEGHSTALDATTAAINLTSTILGAFVNRFDVDMGTDIIT